MDKANDRQERLTESLEAHQLVREARELTDYVNDKKALLLSSAKPSEDVEQVEVIQRKFDDYQKVNRLKIQSVPCLFKIIYLLCLNFVLVVYCLSCHIDLIATLHDMNKTQHD